MSPVLRSDRIAENAKRASTPDFRDVPGLHREIFEERRVMDVITVFIPLINVACARRDFVPLRILFCEIAIKFPERFRCERFLHRSLDLRQSRPKIAKKSLFTVLVSTEWFAGKIDVD